MLQTFCCADIQTVIVQRISSPFKIPDAGGGWAAIFVFTAFPCKTVFPLPVHSVVYMMQGATQYAYPYIHLLAVTRPRLHVSHPHHQPGPALGIAVIVVLIPGIDVFDAVAFITVSPLRHNAGNVTPF